jgi:hypothetical protein
LQGKASVFGGADDSQGVALSGLNSPASSYAGIAVYSQETLGGWWELIDPKGQLAIVRQIDIGPAPYTHRKFDLTPKLAHLFGYSYKSFPTDVGTWQAHYLGKQRPQFTGSDPHHRGVIDEAGQGSTSTASGFSKPPKKDKPVQGGLLDVVPGGETVKQLGGNLLGILGNLSLWKGLGLVIAGAAILIFAALEFRQIAKL